MNENGSRIHIEGHFQSRKQTTYGKLVVRPGGLLSGVIPNDPTKKSGIIDKFRNVFSSPKADLKKLKEARLDNAVDDLPEQLFTGQIDEGDIATFKDLADEPILLGRIVSTFVKKCYDSKFREAKGATGKVYDKEGLIISDLIEVLPEDTAAKLMLTMADPEVTNRLHRLQSIVDLQQIAVAVTCLLPRETRQGLFKIMSKKAPGTSGPAYKLFAFIVSNWVNRMSDYNGQKMIEAHLPADQAKHKIDELSEEWETLGSQLRSGFKP